MQRLLLEPVNMDYEGNRSRPTRVVIKPDGNYERFRNAKSPIPAYEGTYKINSKWTDSAGNIFYKCLHVNRYNNELKFLYKLNKSGKVLEFVYGLDEYPTEVTPRPQYYYKYFRK